MQPNHFETEPHPPLNQAEGVQTGKPGIGWGGWLVLAIIAVAAVMRLVGLASREIHPDEWYHVLAGASWAHGEGLTFIRGIYDRAMPFTISVGLMHSLLGLDGFVAARFPAFLSGLVCVWLCYVLGKRTATPAIGLIAAALMAVDNMGIEWSQLSRFYTMQTAAILGIACIFAGPAFKWPYKLDRNSLIALAGAAALILLALALQVISILAIAGLVLFLFTRTPFFSLEFARTPSKERTWIMLLLVVGAAVGLAGFAMMWPELRTTQAWAAQDKDNLLYYDDYLRAMFGVLWPLTPLAVVAGFFHARKAVLLSLSVIIPVLLVQSLGGMKAPRYIMQATPFLLLLWAVGLHACFHWIAALVREKLPLDSVKMTDWLAKGTALAVIAFALAGNLSVRDSLKWTLKDGREVLSGKPVLDGEPLRASLAAASEEASGKLRGGGTYLIASDPWIQAYFGQPAQLQLINPRNDDNDPLNFEAKTGLVRIGNGAELQVALQCLPSADILLRNDKVGTYYLPPATMAVIEQQATRVPMDHDALRLYRWDRAGDISAQDCSLLESELQKQRTAS